MIEGAGIDLFGAAHKVMIELFLEIQHDYDSIVKSILRSYAAGIVIHIAAAT